MKYQQIYQILIKLNVINIFKYILDKKNIITLKLFKINLRSTIIWEML